MDVFKPLRDLKIYDETRDSMPGEHWLVFGAGIALLIAAGRTESTTHRALAAAAGSALIWRAASGRDGVKKLAPYVKETGRKLGLE